MGKVSEVDIYTDMSSQELQKVFKKSPQAVSNGISRMVARNPEHPEWKYKEGNQTIVRAEGVEWLSTYFRNETSLELVDERIAELEKELQHANEMIAQSEMYISKIEEIYEKTYKERLTEQKEQYQQMFLLEQESKQKKIEILEQEKQDQSIRAEIAEKGLLEAQSRAIVLEQQLNALDEAQALKEAEKADLKRKLKEAEEARIKERDDWKNKSLFQRLFKK